MKILLVSDIEDKNLWDHYSPEKVEGIDLILSCGDLRPEYLEFLVTMTNVPLFYVQGNHDGGPEWESPEGCECIDDRIVTVNGLRILGLGGSMRYQPDAGNMYTEEEMARRIRKQRFALWRSGGIDILLTHAPAQGYGDLPDLAHQGFAGFNGLLERYQPRLMAYGHVHKDYRAGSFDRFLSHPSGTLLVNAWGSQIVEVDE